MRYDIEKIKEEVKPINIIQYLGIRYIRSGKNIFIPCPGHEEKTGSPDHHIGNCVIGDSFQNAYYCFGCGDRGDCFMLIAKAEGLDMKKDFRKILEIAAESCGGSNLYEAKEKKDYYKKKKQEEESRPINQLSKEQLDLIGLNPQRYPMIYVQCFDSSHVSDTDAFIKDFDYSDTDAFGLPATYYLDANGMNFSLSGLAKENYDLYASLVKGKAQETMNRYKALAQKDWYSFAYSFGLQKGNQLFSFCEHAKDYLKNKYLEAETIWKLFATPKEIDRIDDSWIFCYDL